MSVPTRLRRLLAKVLVVGLVVVATMLGASWAWALFTSAATNVTDSATAAAVDHLSISPGSASIAVGGSRSFVVDALDSSNNVLSDVSSSATLSISPDGSCTASTCSASVAGVHTVTAAYWGLSVSTTVNVLSDGVGTMSVSPSTVAASATGQTETLTYTAPAAGLVNGALSVTVPAGWSAPTTTGASAGYVTASSGTVAVSGQTMTVSGVTLGASQTVTITYGSTGAAGPGSNVTATTGAQPWSVKEMSTPGGTMTSLSSSPSVSVEAANGSGTLTTSTTSVVYASTGQSVVFTYSAAAGGMNAGAVTLAVPAGWSVPTTSNSSGCTSATAGVVSVSGQTISVSNVTLAAAATLVVTYGASSGGSCAPGDGASVTATPGSATWTAQQRSTANPGLTNLASSPSISVTKAAQATLSLTSTSATYNGSAYSLSLATSGGSGTGALSFVVAAGTATGCAVSGSTLSATTSGTCLVTATQAADADYNATSSVQTTVTFAMASQSITWSAPGTQSVAVGGTFSLGSASDSSGSTVTFSSSTTGVCTVSGTTVTMVAPGTCTITPSAPASGQYLAATGTATNITINKAAQATLSLTSTSATYNGSAYSLSLATSGGSGTGALSFVVAAGTATGCAVSGSTLSATTSGTCLVTATQAADADYNATSSVQTTVTFAMASQSITWSAPGTQSVAVGGTFSLGSASDSSGSTVTFSSSTTGVCTVSGTTVTVVSFGTCTITPSAPASGQYLATTGTPSNITIAGKTSNGVNVTPSSSNYGNYGGQELLTFTSTSSITAMSVTINVSGTSGLFGCSQFNSYPTGAINESCASAGNGFTFTYTLVNGPIPAGYANGDVGAQWIGIGNAHSFANDTWTVTTTSGGVVSTLSGTFKGN